MGKTLKEHFPMIRTHQMIEEEIQTNPVLKRMFMSWKEEDREEFLDVCTGVKGVKMLYDSYFKEIMNPEYDAERLNDFLSLLLNRKVRIKEVLPGDSTRLADESSLLIMDILVEFEDGTLANLEVQKIGYKFPGQRSACYSADLLLRQYKRIRDQKKRMKKQFSYKDIQDVYVIVLFERSPKEFRLLPDTYRHYVQYSADTGVEIRMPQKFMFFALDVFREKQDNEDVTIHDKFEAWLTFLCRDEPEKIIQLIEMYPEFKPLYEDIYELCRNTEKVMGMFSRELLEMDRNTVKLMIDEMQDEVDELIKERDVAARERDEITKECDEITKERDEITKERDEITKERDAYLKACEEKDREIEELKRRLAKA